MPGGFIVNPLAEAARSTPYVPNAATVNSGRASSPSSSSSLSHHSMFEAWPPHLRDYVRLTRVHEPLMMRIARGSKRHETGTEGVYPPPGPSCGQNDGLETRRFCRCSAQNITTGKGWSAPGGSLCSAGGAAGRETSTARESDGIRSNCAKRPFGGF